MEEELIEIHFSAGSLDEARTVARYLVQEKLVACAQIIPWVESVFLWNEKLDTAQESLLLLKTVRKNFEAVAKILRENSRYEIPEILALPILEVNDLYRDWLLGSTKGTSHV